LNRRDRALVLLAMVFSVHTVTLVPVPTDLAWVLVTVRAMAMCTYMRDVVVADIADVLAHGLARDLPTVEGARGN